MGQSMKFLIAIIKPLTLDGILDALTRIGVEAITVSEARDYGQKGHTEIYRGAEYTARYLPMLRIEIAIPSDQVKTVAEAIVGAAKKSWIGDCKIFVFDLADEFLLHTTKNADIVPRQAA